MRAYIDYANLESFIDSNAQPLYDECLRMLKSQCDILFTFGKKQISSNAKMLAWFTSKMVQGRGKAKETKWDVDFPARPLKTNMHTAFSNEDLTAIYLLNDEKVNSIKERGNILIGNVGDEVSALSSLFYDDYQFAHTLTPKRNMPKWDVISDKITPCSDIIIIDKYLFTEENLLNYNLHSLIGVICNKVNNAKVNIVIFTSPQQSVKVNGKTENIKPEWDKLREQIKKACKRFNVIATVTIIAASSLDEHDRTVFTNYSNIDSGDSFNYYDSNWNIITNSRHFTIHSHGNVQNLENGMYIVEDMQKVIDQLQKKNASHCITGDKESNFLTFSS